MKTIVTGGAGFIGSHVSDALIARGHEVWVVDDLSTGRRQNLPERATFVELDIRRGDEVRALFADVKPDVVCHQAAQTSVSVSTREPVRDAEINILGTLHILNACVAQRTQRLVFASTGGAIYGEVPDGEAAELDWTPRPQSPYACAKFAVEQYLRAYKVEHGVTSTVLRYANVYGPRQDPHGEAGVVAIFAQRLLGGHAIQVNARRETGDAGCVRDYVYVDDVVHANVRACEGELAAPITNVGTGIGTSTLELARAIQSEVGSATPIGYGPRRAGDVERSVLAPSSTLGATIPLAEGIARTVRWFRHQQP